MIGQRLLAWVSVSMDDGESSGQSKQLSRSDPPDQNSPTKSQTFHPKRRRGKSRMTEYNVKKSCRLRTQIKEDLNAGSCKTNFSGRIGPMGSWVKRSHERIRQRGGGSCSPQSRFRRVAKGYGHPRKAHDSRACGLGPTSLLRSSSLKESRHSLQFLSSTRSIGSGWRTDVAGPPGAKRRSELSHGDERGLARRSILGWPSRRSRRAGQGTNPEPRGNGNVLGGAGRGRPELHPGLPPALRGGLSGRSGSSQLREYGDRHRGIRARAGDAVSLRSLSRRRRRSSVTRRSGRA